MHAISIRIQKIKGIEEQMPNKLIKLENNEMILTPCWLETRIEKYSLF
jgi:hypothetical protein